MESLAQPPARMIDLVTPVFDGAVESLSLVAEELKAQTFGDWNWLLCNNGKSEVLSRFVKEQNDPRFLLISAPPLKTESFLELIAEIWRRRNFCLSLVRSELVIMLDADIKILDSDYLKLVSAAALDHSSCDLFVHSAVHSSGVLPRMPVRYGQIDMGCYCARSHLARRIGYPEEATFSPGSRKIRHNDFKFFNTLKEACGGGFYYIDTEPLIEVSGNCRYRNLQSIERDEIQAAELASSPGEGSVMTELWGRLLRKVRGWLRAPPYG